MTTPLNFQKKRQFAGRARQVASDRKKAAKLERDEAEMLSYSEIRRIAMRATLCRFKRPQNDKTTPQNGTFQITAIDHTTGEIREYYTIYAENIKYIGNTDYMAYGRVETSYYVKQWNTYGDKAYHPIIERHMRGIN